MKRSTKTIDVGTILSAMDHLRVLSWRLFIGSLALALVTSATLYVGLGRLGAGHGDSTIWYVGLWLWGLAWCILLGSCITAVQSWRSSGQFAWWVIPASILLATLGLLGLGYARLS